MACVPFLYHAFFGPSVIHPELIDAVHLFAGPAPARFGGNAGGVVSADLRAPSGTRTIGASLGVFDVGGVVDTPFADGKGAPVPRGALLVHGVAHEFAQFDSGGLRTIKRRLATM